jgi:acetyl esterase/lipase
MGDRDDSSDTGYVFRGTAVFQAVLETVSEMYGSPSSVILGGASAGARGAMVHLDYAADYFSPVPVVGILDSPLWVDLNPPSTSSKPGLAYQTQKVYDLVGAKELGEELLGESCMAAHEGEQWKCMFGQYRMEHVSTRFLLVSAEFDSFQLGEDLVAPTSAENADFATEFGSKMRDVFKELMVGGGREGSAYYSQPCYNHAISMSGA